MGCTALYKLQPYIKVDLLRKIYFSIVCHLLLCKSYLGHC